TGIATAEPRVHGHEKAQIEIAHTTLSCRVDGRDVTLNDDRGDVRGGLYRRHPWFGSDAHDPMPLARSKDHGVILRVGTRPERVWHFWAASPPSSAPIRPSRRLHSESSSPNFQGCLTSNGDGLLAKTNHRLRFRRHPSWCRKQ